MFPEPVGHHPVPRAEAAAATPVREDHQSGSLRRKNQVARQVYFSDADIISRVHYPKKFLKKIHPKKLIYFSLMNQNPIRTVTVIRYVTPLREGGSLPAIAEADDGFLYVLKFRGAGQGIKALIAELIGGELARVLGFKVPEIVFANLDPAFGRSEPDEEIQDLLKASTGLNLGLHYLSGAISYDPAVNHTDAETASRVVWLDSLITNVDRTARNTNMLTWNKELWLIDHGAALYFHHSWENQDEQALSAFTHVKNHVLLPQASELEKVNEIMVAMLPEPVIDSIVSLVPDTWLLQLPQHGSPQKIREAYARFLKIRVQHAALFLKEAMNARKAII